jgi:hypothetical protein
MITCNGGKSAPCMMTMAQYLRYYEERHGVRLSRETADKEAAKEGFVLDHGAGETQPRDLSRFGEPRKGVV